MMGCSNCGRGSVIQPAKSNGGLYVMDYIGDKPTVTLVGEITGVVYSFGTTKKRFWVNHKDIPGLFRSEVREHLRTKKQ